MALMKTIRNLVIAGDGHFNSATPQSRIDDFADTSIEKLESLLQLCLEKKYDTLFWLGDFFHKPIQPISYINRIIAVLLKFKANNIDVYSIVGNSHDITYDKLENLPKSSIGLLFNTGLLKEAQLDTFLSHEGYKISVHGFHYPQAIEPVETRTVKSEVNVCLAHRFYENAFDKHSITADMVEALGYNIYALGHDHMPYDLTQVGNKLVIRPGRFMRGTADNYNKEGTQVYVDVITFNGCKEKPRITVTREIVPHKPATEIFNTAAMNKTNSKKTLANLASKVDELLDKMDIDSSSNTTSVYDVLDGLDIDIRIKNRVETYLQANGLFRVELEV